eukprot:TRINITY_DN12147_c0_g1_i11.p1 TRINITY_DN12147_c0_g1~~TRINITY_DN12147_c0_g1_i11.p1  ORF type:complete len:216 (-),score=33.44 TRINITY_DN12147_c0_g1_i11:958-1605(-)
MKVPQSRGQIRGCRVRTSNSSIQRSRRVRTHRTLASRNLDKELYLQQAPQPPYPYPQPQSNITGKIVGGIMLVAFTGVWIYRYFKNKREKKELKEESIAKDGASETEGSFQYSVSRTRQAVHIQKAIMYMTRAMNARSLQELESALKENSFNRRPYLNVYSQHIELMDLYRLFLRNSVVPRDFGVLLQLRTMLGLSEVDAVTLEKEVEQEQYFAI